jgi:cytochrome c553
MKLKATLAIAALVTLSSTGALAAGDAERGKTLYATCGACHGANAEGMEALNAAGELQKRRTRQQPARYLRHADGPDGTDAGRQPGHAGRRRVHQVARQIS